jgi:hypothetical protein
MFILFFARTSITIYLISACFTFLQSSYTLKEWILYLLNHQFGHDSDIMKNGQHS